MQLMRAAGVLVWLCLTGVTVHGERIELAKPLPVLTYKTDGTKLGGKLIAYSEDGFELQTPQGETLTTAWTDLEARNVYLLHTRVFDKSTGGQAWFELGQLLWGFKEGQKWSEQAFATAARLDPSLSDAIEKAKQAPAGPAEPEKPAAPDKPVDGAAAGGAMVQAGAGGAGPQVVGNVDSKFWGPMGDAEQAESVKVLKEFADQTTTQIDPNLKLYETEYFLFYTDLDAREAHNWEGLLDKMYSRLLRMFNLPANSNIWRGKALVFVFREEAKYHQFQAQMHGTNSIGTAGMCHSFGNGFVHIAFYRQPDDLKFAHVLVHESVHGFVHRYRSPVNVVSWINEGLAEWIAYDLVPVPKAEAKMDSQLGAATLRDTHSFRGMFEAEHIAGWQYPVTLDFTRFMINYKRTGYVDFINTIKEGTPWDQSFEKSFGMPLNRFIGGYAKAINVPELTR
ncbi:MAG: hypothetical protein GC162_01835 [Planctomycetes bacterium]|nr:hypothetical protein [Planctomycetota bacterium]